MERFPERPKFIEWREWLHSHSENYRNLCLDVVGDYRNNRIIIGHLYEFCAMNGHLAAFEEVFER